MTVSASISNSGKNYLQVSPNTMMKHNFVGLLISSLPAANSQKVLLGDEMSPANPSQSTK